MYFHGGGFVVATIDTYDESARSLAIDANAIMVSVEYRKASEAPFPAARQDAIDAYRWVSENISAYNGIATELAVAGESAGGNFATEVALAARNQELQMRKHELLIYPITSSNLNQAPDLLYTNSTLPLYTALLPYLSSQYGAESCGREWCPCCAHQCELEGFATTTIIAAEEDPLASDGQAYAAALSAARVPTSYRMYSGTSHEFFGMGAVVAKAKAAELFGAAQMVALVQVTARAESGLSEPIDRTPRDSKTHRRGRRTTVFSCKVGSDDWLQEGGLFRGTLKKGAMSIYTVGTWKRI